MCGFRYSNAKKCSNGGRGLMQLDFTQFISKLEKISPIPIKSLPDREYVEMYVKAYYMPDTVMEEWIQQHSVRKDKHGKNNYKSSVCNKFNWRHMLVSGVHMQAAQLSGQLCHAREQAIQAAFISRYR